MRTPRILADLRMLPNGIGFRIFSDAVPRSCFTAESSIITHGSQAADPLDIAKAQILMTDAETLLAFVEKGFGKIDEYLRRTTRFGSGCIDLAMARDVPVSGVNSFATFGLSKTPLKGQGAVIPFRLELLGACVADEDFSLALAVAAEFYLAQGVMWGPGSVLEGANERATGNALLPHLFVSRASPWKHSFDVVKLHSHDVRFLTVYPIANEEAAYRHSSSAEEFEQLLERRECDFMNPRRQSVL